MIEFILTNALNASLYKVECVLSKQLQTRVVAQRIIRSKQVLVSEHFDNEVASQYSYLYLQFTQTLYFFVVFVPTMFSAYLLQKKYYELIDGLTFVGCLVEHRYPDTDRNWNDFEAWSVIDQSHLGEAIFPTKTSFLLIYGT